MVRAMYSGVAGMKIQQTRMDVIGNNIANVGTHGYKAGRATFRDVYYQTNMAATAATGSLGGRNAMQVGVGGKMGSIDINHSQSVMTTTGFALDVAIAGEGYLQVMDRTGNTFYTKAGMLDIDSQGNLVDVNGNFVLGVSGNPYTKGADNKRIAIKLPNENASVSSATNIANNKEIRASSTDKTTLANVVINFETSNNLPLNSRAKATVNSDQIIVTIAENETFRGDPASQPPLTWLDEFNEAVNDAIKEAYGGVSPLGDLKLEMDDVDVLNRTQMKAVDIVSAKYNYKNGGIGFFNDTTNEMTYSEGTKLPGYWGKAGFEIVSTGSEFGKQWSQNSALNELDRKVGDVSMSISQVDLDGDGIIDGKADGLKIGMSVIDADGKEWFYTCTEPSDSLLSGGSMLLKLDQDKHPTIPPTEADSITLKFPKLAKITATVQDSGQTRWDFYSVNPGDSIEGTKDSGANGNRAAAVAALLAAEKGSVDPNFVVDGLTSYATAQDKMDAITNANANVANAKSALDAVLAIPVDGGVSGYVDQAAKDADVDAAKAQLVADTATLSTAQNAIIVYASAADKTADIAAAEAEVTAQSVGDGTLDQLQFKMVAAVPALALGFGETPFILSGGTEGGPQDASDLTSISINDRGILSAIHPTLGLLELGRIDLATFENPRGLTQVGNTYFAVSQNSGPPKIARAGEEGTGNIASSTLETSNVDLSNEFSDMIVTQRGFQANSRIITVSDSMIEELVNLKR